MNNYLQVVDQIKRKSSFLIVGLDSDYSKFPPNVQFPDVELAIMRFNKAIIEATAAYAVGYKLNSAFYECHGIAGLKALRDTVRYIKEKYPEMLVILDAKRGDIGNTSACYARAAFDSFQADAVTVAPYMGYDSVEPFLRYKDKWTILLALTSNKGSADFQQLLTKDETFVFENVLRTASKWELHSDTMNAEQMMFVVGATQADWFKKIRQIVPDHFLLVPGVGAQGGSLRAVVENGINREFCCLLVNASRSIIFASKDDNFAMAAAHKAAEMQKEMSDLLKEFTLI